MDRETSRGGGKGKGERGGKGSKMKEDRSAVPGVFAIGMGMEPVVRKCGKTKMTKQRAQEAHTAGC